ncbi:MAG: multiheme c-type cytochrome [Wenzhouxiangellaceae bacterium]|nr:multiheme c-type cytochrome [Wenzhouxiangellaceae bacterium]
MNERTARAAILVAGALAVGGAQAQPLPSDGEYMHLGPASCATSVCHGKVTPDETSNVLLNEYRTWSNDDYHSRAYTVLRSEESQRMADRLGLGSATTAKICLDCHADNVPADRRGEKFQISDGVGCEACHGGAERWIESHAEEGATHEDNLARGMYPTEQPEARARLCLSCHVGTEEKFADHDIMAAGHPRMSFELETFTVNQPAHYEIDEDYRERKGRIGSVNMWATGMVMKAERQLDLLRSDLFAGHGLFPELAFFDCHACHHPMNDMRMHATPVTASLPPGMVRLDDSSFQVLMAIGEVLEDSAAERVRERTRSLHTATTRSREAVREAADELGAAVEEMRRLAADRDYSEAEMREIRELLLERAGSGRYGDFTTAEQAFLAVETLTIVLGEYQALGPPLDAWFETLSDEHDFDPARYAAVARRVGTEVR